jgi:uncharacterized membrane protein SpoIIM required for sporulation
VILNLQRFAQMRQAVWDELDRRLHVLESDASARLDLPGIRRLVELYEETVADLAEVRDIAPDSDLAAYLESLIARAHMARMAARARPARIHPWRWLIHTWPSAVRRRASYGLGALAAFLLGTSLGAALLLAYPEARAEVFAGYPHLMTPPVERVALEERAASDTEETVAGSGQSIAAWYWTHNVHVSLFVAASGILWGLGTLYALVVNGFLFGAVVADYVVGGQMMFLLGWLLPHGSVEIPALLVCGQAGLLLGHAALGWSDSTPWTDRVRRIAPDFLTLVGGAAVLLAWAALIEAFFSQFHRPAIPYEVKATFGLIQLVCVLLWIAAAGRPQPTKGVR